MSTNLADLRQKAKLPARQAGGNTVKEFFEHNRGSIAAVLPRHISPDRLMKIAMGALRTTPQLMDASVESLMGAVIQSASLGLEPNTPLGHSYLIPFKNHKKRTTEVQFIPGYKGLVDLARRSGQIVSISAHAVRENDLFEFEYGLDERLRHIPARGEPGPIIAFYAVAKLVGGGHQFEVLWENQVQAIMKATQSKGQYGPWRDHYEEMGRKTAIRRLAKYLPLSIEFATAAALDGMAEGGESQGLDRVLTGEWTITDEAAPAGMDPETGEVPSPDDEAAAERAAIQGEGK